MAQALAPLHGNPRTTRSVAFPPRRAVGAAESRKFHGFVTPRVGAELALGAVGDAHAPLNDAVGAVGERAFTPDAFGFNGAGGGQGGRLFGSVGAGIFRTLSRHDLD